MSLILHDNVIEGVTPTATNEVAGFEGVNVNNWLLYNSWKPGVTGTQDLVFDMSVAKIADTIAIYGHNLGSEGCSFQVDASTNNVDWVVAVASFVVADDGVIFKQFATKSKRYWRVRITNCTVDALISVVALGEATVLPGGQYDGYSPSLWGAEKNINSVAVNGNFLGRSVQPVPFKSMIKQKAVSQSFVRGDWATFIAHAKNLPFFFAWDETNYPEETIYAWTDKTIPLPKTINHELYSIDLPIMALRD